MRIFKVKRTQELVTPPKPKRIKREPTVEELFAKHRGPGIPPKNRIARAMRAHPTKTEQMFAELAAEHIRHKCEPQIEILGYIVDFYVRKAKTIIEIDGSIHYRQQEYDATRDEAFRNSGFYVIRVKAEDLLNDPIGEVMRVREQLDANYKAVGKIKHQRRKRRNEAELWKPYDPEKPGKWWTVPGLTRDHLPANIHNYRRKRK